jgi:predicted DNA-binding protein (MmcQ/YjbR family)
MDVAWVREYCISFSGVTEHVQWGNHLVFKVGGKMFAVAALEPGGHFLSLKSTRERFADLTDRPGVIPAPYLARAYWVALEQERTLSRAETKALLDEAYEAVLAKLPKKTQAVLRSKAIA